MRRGESPRPLRRALGLLVVLVLKAAATALIIAIPVAGVWVASSLAAYANGPVGLVVGAGLVLFPVGPLAWDLFGEWRRRRQKSPKPRILTFWDRLLWRTLLVNLAFLGVLLGTRPAAGFIALSTRGDWMLDGREASWAPRARSGLHRAADGLEWLYLAVHEDTYAKGRDPGAHPTPAPQPSLPTVVQRDGPGTPTPTPTPAPAPAPAPTPTAPIATPARRAWPFAPALHPLVASIPPEAEVDVETLARYVRDHEDDPLLRVKALHDWVADRISYDAAALASGEFPPQDPVTVLRTRKAVCAGYALLLEALGRAAGDSIEYVSGDIRRSGQGLEPLGHAWNAAKVGGTWYLIDATWDAGTVDGLTYTKGYRTEYFFTPPEVFGLDHFPREDRWQLRDQPLSRGDFLRQPLVTPQFAADGMRMVWPDRSQITVQSDLWITIENPERRFLLARRGPKGGDEHDEAECEVHDGPRAKVHCAFPAAGTWEVRLFSNESPYGSFRSVARVEVNRT